MNKALLLSAAITLLSTASFAEEKNSYVQHNFISNKAKYNADVIEPNFINGWGVAIRPSGAGGHFWVTAKDVSYEYVGDVTESPVDSLKKLHTDELKYVKLPVGGDDKFATGVVFSDSTDSFVITQKVPGAEDITAPAKFLFSSDGGTISAWTERKKAGGTFDRTPDANLVIDDSAKGSQYFGIAVNSAYNRLYVADFGTNPTVKVFDAKFQPANIIFDQPFDENNNGKVDAGEYAPFNVQTLKTPGGEGASHVFVAYAKTQSCPAEEVVNKTCEAGAIFPGEEDTAKDGNGRVAEFTEDGKLVAVWDDAGKLSAPWGMAYAPADFGALSGKLLVGNFGSGHIAAYDATTRKFVDYAKDAQGKPLNVDKVWGFLFGNGESLGDSNALYFGSGPGDEQDGIFGSIRVVK